MTERFILQPSQEQGFWVATDTVNGIVIKFREHQFNETQQTTLLNGETFKTAEEALAVATYMREIADWLRENHYTIAMPEPENIRLRIGLRIKELRTSQKLTQQQLADMAGVTKANICNIERGAYSVGLDILNKIATALNSSIQIINNSNDSNIMTTFANLSDSQIEKLFTLAPSTWKESSPYWHHDYQRTADKTCIAKNLIKYVWSGDCDNVEQAKAILNTMKSHDDRMAFAKMMVDADNYTEFAPDYKNLGQDEELEKVLASKMEAYNGLDAYVEAAQLELACNIAEEYADVEDLIKLFR